MSNRSIRLATLACAAVAVACALARPARAQETPAAPAKEQQKAAPGKCTACKVEIDNRFDYQVMIFDRRETQSRTDTRERSDTLFVGGTITPVGRALARATALVTTKGRPNLGMAVLQDLGTPPTIKGLKYCRQEAVRPGSDADFRYVCGN